MATTLFQDVLAGKPKYTPRDVSGISAFNPTQNNLSSSGFSSGFNTGSVSGGGGGGTGGSLTQVNGNLIPSAPTMQAQDMSAPTSGGGPSLFQPTGGLEQGPVEADINPDYSAALGALSNLQNSLRSQLPGQEQQLTNEADVQRQQVEAERARRTAELESQGIREGNRTEQNVAEQRRISSELAQGLQARFGATTGTGQFASEILGRESMRNIANDRSAFQDTMRQITDETNKVMSTVQNQLFEIDKNLESSKIEARNQLSQRLAEIDAQKGELESRKADLKFDMLKQFALANADIEARNIAFKQDLYMKAQTIQNQYAEFKNSFNPDVNTALNDVGALNNQFNNATAGFSDTGSNNMRYVPTQNYSLIDDQFGVPTNAIGAQE
jgi:hypothetical protein